MSLISIDQRDSIDHSPYGPMAVELVLNGMIGSFPVPLAGGTTPRSAVGWDLRDTRLWWRIDGFLDSRAGGESCHGNKRKSTGKRPYITIKHRISGWHFPTNPLILGISYYLVSKSQKLLQLAQKKDLLEERTRQDRKWIQHLKDMKSLGWRFFIYTCIYIYTWFWWNCSVMIYCYDLFLA